MIEKRPFRYFLNRNHGVPGIAVLPEGGYARAKAEISTWPGYAPTPLVALDAIAKATGVARLHYKDEAARFGLASFKALGGAYAVMRVLQAELAKRDVAREATSADLIEGRYKEATAKITVCCATDGNHGRSVAGGRSGQQGLRRGISRNLKNSRGTLRRSRKQGEYPRVCVLLQRSAGIYGELQGADFETRIMRRIRDFFRVSFSSFELLLV